MKENVPFILNDKLLLCQYVSFKEFVISMPTNDCVNQFIIDIKITTYNYNAYNDCVIQSSLI